MKDNEAQEEAQKKKDVVFESQNNEPCRKTSVNPSKTAAHSVYSNTNSTNSYFQILFTRVFKAIKFSHAPSPLPDPLQAQQEVGKIRTQHHNL